MATSTASGYGAVSPAAIDPFPIESVLAKIVGEQNPQEAANMLDTYQIERQTSQGNYDYALKGQHDFAKQALEQQLHEQYMKSAMDAVQHPGGLSVLRGVAPGALAGVDPSVTSGIETNLRDLQRAEQFQKGAAGLQSSTTAGFQSSTPQAAVATGGLTGPQGTPEAEKVAGIAAAARLAAASIRAKSASADADRGSFQMPPDPRFPGMVGTERPLKGESYDQFTARMQAQGRLPTPVEPIPGQTTGGQLPPSVKPKGAAVGTNLQPASGKGGTSAAPQIQPLPATTPGATGYSTAIKQNLKAGKFAPDVAQRIQSGMVNGEPRMGRVGNKVVVLDGQGKPVL